MERIRLLFLSIQSELSLRECGKVKAFQNCTNSELKELYSETKQILRKGGILC